MAINILVSIRRADPASPTNEDRDMTLARRHLLGAAAAVPVAALVQPAGTAIADEAKPRPGTRVVRPGWFLSPKEAEPALAGMTFRRDVVARKALPYGVGVNERGPAVAINHVPRNSVIGADGVVRFRAPDNKLYLHPVTQCHYGVSMLHGYTRDPDPARITAARRQADALAAAMVRVGDAAFMPYQYDWAYYGESLGTPWYSGMAQGLGVHLMTLLYNRTGEARYRTLADQLFNGFLRPYSVRGIPWVSGIDNNKALWLDEYPRQGGALSKVYNGHIIGTMSLYRYWQLVARTDFRRAELVKGFIDGGLSTAKLYREACRVPGTASSYVVNQVKPHPTYHPIHVGLLRVCFDATADPAFATTMDAMIGDFRDTIEGGSVSLQPGTYTLRKFDASGRTTATKVWTTTRATSAPCSERIQWLSGDATKVVWLPINAGGLAGWSAPQTPGKVFVQGLGVDAQRWIHPRPVSVRAGVTFTAHAFNETGGITSSRTTKLSSPVRATSMERACVRGRQMVKIADGAFAGLWIELGVATFV